MIKNSYFAIAENDLEYLESVVKSGSTFYNQLAVQCQQVAEKYLKGCLDKFMTDKDISDLLRKHNMKIILMRFIREMISIPYQKKNLKSVWRLSMTPWRD